MDTGSGWTTVVRFMPDGTCDDDAELLLISPNCRPVSFRVRALTGAIRVRTLSAEEIQQ